MDGRDFYLGTHKPGWLERAELGDARLFVSARRLRERVRPPRAARPWALDSGGFTELTLYGEWRLELEAYVDEVARWEADVGRLEWACPMDWLCAPPILERTGLTVAEHQHRTTANYLELAGRGPFVPVLQGWTPGEYVAHAEAYLEAGVDLAALERVAVGSVAARQGTPAAARVFAELAPLGLRLHGLGVKATGVAAYGRHLVSADSVAWSFEARRRPPLPGCTHARCSNCHRYALRWRDRVLEASGQAALF